MNKTAYLDNNIFVSIEKKSLSIESLICNVDKNLNEFSYSMIHLMETNEKSGENEGELENRLKQRFSTISLVTNNTYVVDSNLKVYKSKINPEDLFKNSSNIFAVSGEIKEVLQSISEEHKNDFRERMGIDSNILNNYSAEKIIEHINAKSKSLGGLPLMKIIENNLDENAKNSGMGSRFSGLFEFLDLVGYWKDKVTPKSSYARLWDSSHCYFGSYFDYFISNDKQTRNKARVAYKLYGAKTIVASPNGKRKN